MENYSLSELVIDPAEGYVSEFRKAAAQIAATIDLDPLTGLPRGGVMGQNLSALAPQAMDPMMPMGQNPGQVDMAMLPPQFHQGGGVGPMAGGPQPNIQDPMGGMQGGMQNNPMMNNLGV